jgi:uncharacterized protein YxjI
MTAVSLGAPRTLTLANKLLSLRGEIRIEDGSGDSAYVAKGQFAFFPTWRVYRGGAEVARIRRKVFAIRPTWLVNTNAEAFQIRRKLLAFRRRYYAVGGSHDGATLTGNLFDLSFQVQLEERSLARASGRILTLRDTHSVQVLTGSAEDELFVVTAMLVLQLDRRDEASRRRDED